MAQEKTQAERTRLRGYIYELLAGVYRMEPSGEFLEKLQQPACLERLKDLGLKLGRDFECASSVELVEELSVEYTRLFIGPGTHIYPYESAYQNLDGLAKAKASSRIKTLIQSTGLEYRSDFSGRPDHISVEFEFMAKLIEAELSARKKKNRKEIDKFIEFERKFLDEHLLVWVGEFSKRVIKQAALSFYREMARLTQEYVSFDAANLNKHFR